MNKHLLKGRIVKIDSNRFNHLKKATPSEKKQNSVGNRVKLRRTRTILE